MQLTIVIVSYEVKYFLELCLFSAIKAANKIGGSDEVEIIVVDNASSDGTVEYLSGRFPMVRFIANRENLGFAKANNFGLAMANGGVILFLNPDTILPESILVNCLSFINSNAKIGGLGVRMIDGGGGFLPESKRGFPTPWRSFCKLSGLSSIFPSSKMFSGYNLGHLKQDRVYPVEVLAGAFMMVEKNVLDQVGGFDEQFFMYAEDIDLSKRIRDAGFVNYYLGNETIIHFKGESTIRDKRYVQLFYDAMRQYARKHYGNRSSKLAVAFMNMGIGLRSLVAKWAIKSEEQIPPVSKTLRFVGDARTIEAIKQSMPELKDDPNAQEVLICEGDSFSFNDMVRLIQELPFNRNIFIHAKGSSSIVSSNNKMRKGLVIPLPS